MKILLINTSQTDKNGITNVIFYYLNAIHTEDITFDLLAINKPDNSYVSNVERLGGKLHVFDRSFKNIIGYWFALKNLVKKEKYDAVHIHGNSHTLVLDLSAVYFAGCSVRIVHSHNTKCYCPIVHRVLSGLFNVLVTHCLACGADAGKWMFGKKRNFLVLNNGVETQRFAFNPTSRQKMRELYGWNDDCVVLGHVGAFYPVKNHCFIVSVFESLYKDNKNFRLLLVGDGQLKDEILMLIEQKGLKEVCVLPGNVSNVDMQLNAMDVTIMPSLFEGLPLCLIEQQTNGLSCVVSDKVTTEVNLTNNIHFLGLESSLDLWADYINKSVEKNERMNKSMRSVAIVKEAGYDVNMNASKLKDFYKEAISNTSK